MGEVTQTPRRSTRQLLGKIPNFPSLYRHLHNGTYYAIKKIAGKRKEHSLGTSDRKIAERRLKDWVADMDKVDAEAEKITLEQLIDKFQKTREGRADKTRKTEAWIIKQLRAYWAHGLDIRVSRIRPSMLDEWLAKMEPNLKNSSYNRVALLLKQLFELAVNDRIIAESPCQRLQKGWKKPGKPKRIVPTDEQFQNIVEAIRTLKFNREAEESANFVEFLGLAGLGEAEASTITWGDIDWAKDQFTVRRQKTGVLFFVPIYPGLKPLLQRLLAKQPAPPAPDTTVFKMRSARKALQTACTRLGYPKFSPRSIRAYCIRRLWRAKVDIKLIAKWQGHSDGGELCLNTYTEVFGANDQEYVSAELSKLSPALSPASNVILSAEDHQKLLAELHRLRAQVSSAAEPSDPKTL